MEAPKKLNFFISTGQFWQCFFLIRQKKLSNKDNFLGVVYTCRQHSLKCVPSPCLMCYSVHPRKSEPGDRTCLTRCVSTTTCKERDNRHGRPDRQTAHPDNDTRWSSPPVRTFLTTLKPSAVRSQQSIYFDNLLVQISNGGPDSYIYLDLPYSCYKIGNNFEF